MYDAASTTCWRSAVAGRRRRRGHRRRQFAAGGAGRAEPAGPRKYGIVAGPTSVPRSPTPTLAAQGRDRAATAGRSTPTTRPARPAEYAAADHQPTSNGAPVQLSRCRPGRSTRSRTCAMPASPTASRSVLVILINACAQRQHHRDRRPRDGAAAELRASISPASTCRVTMDRSTTIRASLHEVERTLMIATAW
jgi:hypothetical protein